MLQGIQALPHLQCLLSDNVDLKPDQLADEGLAHIVLQVIPVQTNLNVHEVLEGKLAPHSKPDLPQGIQKDHPQPQPYLVPSLI